MPWLAVPYEDNASRTELTTLYGIQGIPSLVLLNPDGSVITEDGRGEISDDPQGMVCPRIKCYAITRFSAPNR